MPLSGAYVIPPGWAEHHQPVSANAMPDQCIVHRPGSGVATWNPVTERTEEAAPTVVYSGPCRVTQLIRTPSMVEAAEEYLMPRQIFVAVPVGSITEGGGMARGDEIDVTSSADPTLLTGQLQVVSVHQSSERFERVALCEEANSGPGSE
jgi:hypothetical protein